MIEKHIHKLNVNPFFSSYILLAFFKGYESKKCPLLLLYVVLPLILSGTSRKALNSINKANTLTNFTNKNKEILVDLQLQIWDLRKLTNMALVVLYNNNEIKLQNEIEILKTIDHNNYNDDLKSYFRAAYYLGILFNKETIQTIFKTLKIIP